MWARSSTAFHSQGPIRSKAKSDREIVLGLYHEAVAAADPIRVSTSLLQQIEPPAPPQRVWLVAIGKAAHGMATAVASWLRASDTELQGGLVVSTHSHSETLRGVHYLVGDHPIPGARSRAAAEELGRLVSKVQAGDQVYVLISGGTSSLIGAPLAGVPEAEYRAMFERLLASGLDITAMNALRRQQSRWANGRLASALSHASIQPVIMSDVLTDDPATIGSGPCHPEVSGEAGHVAPPLLAQHDLPVRSAIAAAAEYASPIQPGPELRGDAQQCGRDLARHLLHLATTITERTVVVCGGETTVTLTASSGLGGRCQELALSAAKELARSPSRSITLLAAGTDGRDGPTDAAGAIINSAAWQAAIEAGVNPAQALEGHDSYTALDAIGALVRTGPTGTNMLDLGIAVVHPVKHLAP